ncbi:IclR family transcriptional regulator [Halegenticoccus tardaugens]|uniref:IclR family transcriptional regulator n=1 Tax=Halegenticoccus tardaugens TaxID=2071624 RepID=UPI00100BDF87|nr:IclR family transcriptional regulator [Halegenticoccus tardaugens]
MAAQTDGRIGALETSLHVLEALKRLGGAGVTELAKELNIPKSTVYSHLSTLRQNEYVMREGDTYRVGLKFLDLGEHARNRMGLYDMAKPQVDLLAEETGELANLLVEEHGEGVYIYRAKGSQAVQVDTRAGMRVKLHCTSLGKAILAYLPEEKVDVIINRWGLPERTPQTITNRETLEEELANIRERRYAQDDGERLPGLRCIAAPVLDQNGRAVGAISVSGPKSRMRGEKFTKEIPELVQSAANVTELNMTYS